MRSTLVHLDFEWEPLPDPLRGLGDRLLHEFEGWRGTPHRPGQKCKGVGVDCVRFVVSVLESLTGRVSGDVKIPQDASMHNKAAASRALRLFLSSWPLHEDIKESGKVQPGDVIIVGPPNGGPGHALIVGVQKNTLWHAANSGVRMCGWCLERPMTKVFRVYRGTDRRSWL